jgi:hypothetical protein
MTAGFPRRWALAAALTATVLMSSLALLASTATAGAPRHGSRSAAISSATIPRALSVAAMLRTQADHRLVAQARALKQCARAHPRRPRLCAAGRSAVQRAGQRLRMADRHLSRVASGTSRPRRASASIRQATRQAPRLTVAGYRLAWTQVARVRSYLLVLRVPGQAPRYSVVRGTAVTPPPVPGTSVTYSVRTAVYWSAWSDPQTIAYPAPAPNPSQPSAESQAAPVMTLAGKTLSWNALPNVNTYVLASRVEGQPERFTVVAGTSITPTPVPGASVHYSVRTAVYGSAWSHEVVISYPAASAPQGPPASPKESPAPGLSGFQPGIDAGWNMTLDVSGATTLGARVVRIEFPIGATAAQIQPVIAGYAAKGIRVAPLATFYGTMPTPAEAQSLANWAKSFGPGGSFWSNRSDGQLAIRTIEFGNETSGGYQYHDNAGDPSYQARAQTYALRIKEAAEAISSAGVNVGLLAVAEDWTGDWMNGMFAAVPKLGSYLAGWVSHPYGSGWRGKIEGIISQAATHGAPATLPIDVTEWGISTDNGSCLSENYHLNPCMTYQEAGETLRRNVGEIRQLLGSRAGLFMLYQVRDQQLPNATHNREDYFGLLQHELQPKGAYTVAAQELLAS